MEGVFFLYQRRADPKFGFIILNRHNSTNLIEPVTSEFDFKFEGNFLLYKNKVRTVLTYVRDATFFQFQI